MNIPHKVNARLDDLRPDYPNSSWIASMGGAISLGCTAFIFFGLQRIFQHLPPFQLLDAMHGTSNTLCFAGITASATIMPLMLTIFSFARNSEREFNPWFYQRIKSIAFLCCIAFVTGLFTLTVLSAPIGDMPEVSDFWYRFFYYVIVAGLSSMVGVLVGILILLYYSILHIINQLNPHAQSEKQK